MDQEVWVKIDQFENYSISNHGRVLTDKTGNIRKPGVNQRGMEFYTLRDSHLGRYVSVTASTLVGVAFCPGQSDKTNTILHLDGNQMNHHADNLMWATRWHTVSYHREIQDPRWEKVFRISDDLGRVYRSIKEAAMTNGDIPSTIEFGVRYNDQNKEMDDKAYYPSGPIFVVHKVWPSGRVYTRF